MDQPTYDYAIIGAGASGLHLILKMIHDPFFREKKILLIDKDDKTANDRTWSFWEKGNTEWDEVSWHSWGNGQFINQKETIEFDLNPYRYKSVRGLDFYNHAREILKEADQVEWVKDVVNSVAGQLINGKQKSYAAKHIFDSRVSPEFNAEQHRYHSLIQHFRGWFIKTEKPIFDPQTFVMMDYRLKWKDSTSFTYILPSSPNQALVEFTLFNDTLLSKEEYEHFIRLYIDRYLGVSEYEIEEVEQGIIPMSDYPFHKHHEKHLTKIGTAGGWVRPSSGYSFKNGDRYSTMMIENIKNGKRPEKGIATSRYRTYDSIFLNVLKSRNDLGEEIFTRLYTKPDIQSVFRFLDEESSFSEDIKVMFSLNKPQLWKAFLKTFFYRQQTP